jgi:hypothetical protein
MRDLLSLLRRLQNLVTQLSARVERLQISNAHLIAVLEAVTRRWRDVSTANCDLKASLVLAQEVQKWR